MESSGKSDSESKLRGDLLRATSESKLRGNLLNKVEISELDISEEILGDKTFINRDTSEEFLCDRISRDAKYGDKILLKRVHEGRTSTINLSLSEFISKLKTPGSAWRIKK